MRVLRFSNTPFDSKERLKGQVCFGAYEIQLQERLKHRNTLGYLDEYAAQNRQYARPPNPPQPPTQKVFFQCHTKYDPTMKHSHCETVYAKERSNGCSWNWFTPSEFFKFSQLTY